MTNQAAATAVDDPETAAVLDVVSGMLREMLDEYELDDVEIAMDSTFHEDLGLESIDLVALASRLAGHYGERVNLAEFLADKELKEVIGLTVGQLVRYVAGRL